MEALLSSLITRPKDMDRFIVSVSFHFQCIKKLVFSTVVFQLGKIMLGVLVFKMKGIPLAGFHNFSAPKYSCISFEFWSVTSPLQCYYKLV